tara:strand:- start:1502 stop:2077 length:576 start_codon:yes stop_codon:yes gene_type:complete
MSIKSVKITEVKVNPNNPRIIKDDKFKKLVQSIKDFPEMLNIRPIVVNQDMIILGGNMRYKACKEAGLKEIPIIITDLTEEQQREFLIKDNTSGGEWDWDMLANEWKAEELEAWGLDVWLQPVEVDYSILDDDDVSEQLDDMTAGVKKAIQIEFEAEHYEEAYALVKFWREREAYVGGMIMEYLKSEKEKL